MTLVLEPLIVYRPNSLLGANKGDNCSRKERGRMRLKHYYIELTIPQILAIVIAFFLIGRAAAAIVQHPPTI